MIPYPKKSLKKKIKKLKFIINLHFIIIYIASFTLILSLTEISIYPLVFSAIHVNKNSIALRLIIYPTKKKKYFILLKTNRLHNNHHRDELIFLYRLQHHP